MKASNFKSIEERLSQRDPSYPDKIKATDRRRYDWSLCESGMLSEAELLEIYLVATQLPTIEEDELPEPAAVPYLSAEYLTANGCRGLEDENNVLKLLVCDPYSINRHRYFIETLHGKEVHFYLIRRSLLERLIAKLHAAAGRMGQRGTIDPEDLSRLGQSLQTDVQQRYYNADPRFGQVKGGSDQAVRWAREALDYAKQHGDEGQVKEARLHLV